MSQLERCCFEQQHDHKELSILWSVFAWKGVVLLLRLGVFAPIRTSRVFIIIDWIAVASITSIIIIITTIITIIFNFFITRIFKTKIKNKKKHQCQVRPRVQECQLSSFGSTRSVVSHAVAQGSNQVDSVGNASTGRSMGNVEQFFLI